jgi:hypothetical protein
MEQRSPVRAGYQMIRRPRRRILPEGLFFKSESTSGVDRTYGSYKTHRSNRSYQLRHSSDERYDLSSAFMLRLYASTPGWL